MKTLKYLVLAFALFTFSMSAGAGTKLSEDQKIEGLLKAIQTSNAVFVRNGEDHPANEAVAHLRSKLDAAANSWLAPKRSDWTAKMFIEKIASKSSLSGQEYLVRLPNKRLCQAKVWLAEQLAILEAGE